jgi:hypothetical protein
LCPSKKILERNDQSFYHWWTEPKSVPLLARTRYLQVKVITEAQNKEQI